MENHAIDMASNKTLKMAFDRSKTYKDLVKDHLLGQHLKVMATNETSNNGTTSLTEPWLGEEGKIKLTIKDSNRMQYYSKMFVGSEQ